MKYTEEHKIFRQALRKFLEKEVLPYVDEWEKKEGVPRSLWKKLGEGKYLCTWVDKRYGGFGAGFEYTVILREEFAKANFGIGIAGHSDIVAPYIADYGTEGQKKRWLPGCTTGDIILSIAMTEADAGSDLKSIRTTAVKDGDYFVINGQKTYITCGIDTDLVILAAKTDLNDDPVSKGISLFAVEVDTPGFVKSRKLNKMGLHSQDTAELYFDNCWVPTTNMIGEEGMGFSYLKGELQRERLVLSIWAQATAERILSDALIQSKTNQACLQPIGNFQHIAFEIAEMATEVELGRSFVDKLIEEFMAGKNIVTRVSMAKWWTSEMANRIACKTLELYRDYGYMEENPLARLYRDVRAQPIFGGTTEIMKLIISNNLGLK